MSKYKIVFTGMDIPEHHRERVKANLSVIFKVPATKLAVLFQDRPVTIKKDLDLVAANRYRDAVVREGGACRVEPMNEGTASMSMTIEARERPVVTCPRCATRQESAPICAACGVILKNYDDEIRAVKASQPWRSGVDPDRRRSADRRQAEDRRTDLRLQNDRRTGGERRAGIAGWHRNRDAVRN